MSNQSTYHHLLPQTHMSPWKFLQDSVYAVNKGDKTGEAKNTNNFGGVNHYHTIRAGFLIATTEECEQFFQSLKSYTVSISEQVVTDVHTMNETFYDFDNWTICDSSGKEIGSKKKDSLKKSILATKIQHVESNWSIQFENYWGTIVQDVVQMGYDNIFNSTTQHLVEAKHREELIEFMISMKWRTRPYPSEFTEYLHAQLSPQFDDLDLTKMVIPKEERFFPFLETVYDEYAHNHLLTVFEDFQKGKGIITEEINRLKNHYSLTICFAPSNTEFVLTDNPVYEFYKKDGKRRYFFPITPKVAILFSPGSSTNFYVAHMMKRKNVLHVNHEMKKNAHEVYIMKGPNPLYYF